MILRKALPGETIFPISRDCAFEILDECLQLRLIMPPAPDRRFIEWLPDLDLARRKDRARGPVRLQAVVVLFELQVPEQRAYHCFRVLDQGFIPELEQVPGTAAPPVLHDSPVLVALR